MKKIVLLFLFVIQLFSYDVYVKSKADVLILNTLGIECQKEKEGYLCAKFQDYEKVKKFEDFLLNYGVRLYIKDFSDIIKDGYCIQVGSSKNFELLKNSFYKLKKYPYARIEKIGKYFVLRVGEDRNVEELKNYLKKIKKNYKDAFIRKCDLIKNRIKISNFNFEEKKEDVNLSKLSNEKIIKQLPLWYEKKEYIKALKAIKILKKTIYKKRALIYEAKILYKMGKYKKACLLAKKLFNIYKSDLIKDLMVKSCYDYYVFSSEKKMYISSYEALLDLKEAFKLKQDKRGLRDLAIIYFNLGEYSKAYEIIKKLDRKDNSILSIYLKTLFMLNKDEELNKVCSGNENLGFCKDFLIYKKAKEYYKLGEYQKAYIMLSQLWKLYKENAKINYLLAEISFKLKKYDEVLFYIKNLKNLDNLKYLIFLRNIYYQLNDIQKAYYYAKIIQSKNSDKLNEKIINDYKKVQAYKLIKESKYKEALDLLNSIPNDDEVLEIKGKIYEYMKEYKKAIEYYKLSNYMIPKKAISKKLIKLYFLIDDIDSAKKIVNFKDKELSDVYYLNLARYYLKQNNIIKMNKTLNKVQNKELKDYKLLKGILCFYQKEFECALNYLKPLPSTEDRNYYLILTYIKIDNKKDAKKLLKYFKVNNENKNKIINIYIQLGEIKKAKELLKN